MIRGKRGDQKAQMEFADVFRAKFEDKSDKSVN